MQRRLNYEFALLEGKQPGTSASEDGRYYDVTVVSPSRWIVTLRDLVDTPYEGGYFHLQVDFPDNYPFKVPSIKFLTQIYHPNVSQNGDMCVGILRPEEWTPSYTIEKCITYIYTLLVDPNMDDPVEAEIGNVLRTDPDEFLETSRKWVGWYAKDKTPPS